MPPPMTTFHSSTTLAAVSRRRFRSAVVAILASLLALVAPVGAYATPQQVPNSRVVLDLPPGFIPSPLFSGFQNDTTGVSYVILEAPVGEYDKMAQGFNPEELAKRGITQVEKGTLARTDDYVYMRATQKSEAGTYAKFFVLFRTNDQTILVSVNVPKRALDDGNAKRDEIERVLATAKTTEKPAVRDLYSLSYLGPFKEAGKLVGTSKVYTLDGRLEPDRPGETRSAFMVAPSLDKRPITEPEKLAVALLASMPGYKDFKPGEPRPIIVGGLDGIEVTAEATDEHDGKPIHLYQTMLLGKDGGYFRLIGIAAPKDMAHLAGEFPKIAESFALLP
ncbi:MAG: hypothetical protein WC829_03835 [Hyphomicrobium sp.]|jgi:hypothetical protein